MKTHWSVRIGLQVLVVTVLMVFASTKLWSGWAVGFGFTVMYLLYALGVAVEIEKRINEENQKCPLT
jgi:hypothetical protein